MGLPRPLPPKEWPAVMREALAPLTPPTPRPEGSPKALNLLGTFAWHPTLSGAFNRFNSHLLYTSTLTPRDRELVVLRVAAVRDAAYEWAQHAVLAAENGISPEELERVRVGPDAPGWSTLEAALLRAVDELVADACIAPDTLHTLAADLDEQQLLDLVFTIGCYELLAMAMRTFDVPLDDDLR